MTFVAPTEALLLALRSVGGLDEDMAAGRAGDLTAELLEDILQQAARFAETELAPQNAIGDRIGARLQSGQVIMPPGWPAIYRAWAEAGWNGVDLPQHRGGMGLPTRLATATMEIFTAANMGFALLPVLTQGAVDALEAHAAPDLADRFVPNLATGAWTATMNLTEPQAGSDLGQVRTRAVRADDGTWRLFGNKIFITYGAHDLAPNIIHLVLARAENAPEGTRGLSLFLVPQRLPGADGLPVVENDVRCIGIEHKLGIHASPTCAMSFGEAGGAVGWLVGEENRGLAGMFTMMNKARLYTGLQGVAIAERAHQHALAYARFRRQGRAPGAGGAGPDPIIAHPDVRRMLASMRALVAAGRALAMMAAAAIDRGHRNAPQAERAALLTPLVKAYGSEIGCDVSSLGIQVHGGAGYVEETGAAQFFRDARITPIYEGTNGIQAIDFVMRKVLRPGSVLAETLIDEFSVLARQADAANIRSVGTVLSEACDATRRSTAFMRAHAADTERLLGAATPYLQLFARTAALAGLAQVALAAHSRIEAGKDGPACREALADATFYAETIAIHAAGLDRIVRYPLPE